MKIATNELHAQLLTKVLNKRVNAKRVNKITKFAYTQKNGDWLVYDLTNAKEMTYVGENG